MAGSDELALVLDQGGSSSRALILNACGDVVAAAQRQVVTRRPHPGWVEQDPRQVVDSLREVAISAVAGLTQQQRAALQVAGLVCQRSSLVGWCRDTGEPLTPVISWQDTRNSEWLKQQPLDRRRIQQLTGLFPNGHFGASKMRWCLDHLPELAMSASLALAPLASFLVYSLLEERPYIVDPANASRTLLMNLQQRQWSAELLRDFGLERLSLPEIAPSLAMHGHLSVGGLKLPFNLLNGDQSAAAFAGGVPQSERAYINLGTGAFIYRVLSRPEIPEKLLCSVLAAGPSGVWYAQEGTVNGAASALQWLAERQGREGDQLPTADRLLDIQQQLPLFINSVGGLGSPDWRPDIAPHFVGEGREQDKPLAVLESIAFLLMRNFEHLYATAPRPCSLIVSGGLSRLDALCQLLADLTGVTVERVEEMEASARGAGFLLLGARGYWRGGVTTPFAPIARPIAGERYRRWTRLMEELLSNSGDR